MNNTLQIQQLEFAYAASSPVLKGVNLRVAQGEKHGILGENGAGKTTFFRLLAGWLPTAGAEQIIWNNRRPDTDQVAFLEAEPYFYPYMTGREYLRFIRDDRAAIDRWNKLFDLPLDGQFAEAYSTGMKKKLALMGTLLQNRPITILDEPFNGVDLEGNETMMAILQHGALQHSAVLISSHILHTLTLVCDRISVLSGGVISRTVEKREFASLESDIRQKAQQTVAEVLGQRADF